MDRKQFLFSVAGASLSETIASSCMASERPKSLASPKSPLALTVLSSSLPIREVVNAEAGRPARILTMSSIAPHFNVAIQNISTQPIRIWDEDNSWGYDNLTLEISVINSKLLRQSIRLVRISTNWFKNFGEFSILAPGEMIMREVDIEVPNDHPGAQVQKDRRPYRGFPMESMAVTTSCRMRAVYTVEPDLLAKQEGVWTGRIASPEHTYIFR